MKNQNKYKKLIISILKKIRYSFSKFK